MSRATNIKTLILQFLLKQNRLGHQPNSNTIRQHLIGHNQEISMRQLQRHLRDLIEEEWIDYNPRYRTYSLDEEHFESNLNSRQRLERSMAYESIWSNQNSFHPEGHLIISFEAYNNFKGAENLSDLLMSIRANKVVRFHYINYYEEGADSDRRVAPLFLKEYLNRWYLVAWDLDKDGQRLFGIDRILNLTIDEETFTPTEHYQTCWDKFKNVVGLKYSEGDALFEPMELIIRSDEINIPFLDSLPLHHSQQKIPAPEGEKDQTRYKFLVVPNLELRQRLLSMSPFVEIESPEWYRKQFKEELKEVLKRYG